MYICCCAMAYCRSPGMTNTKIVEKTAQMYPLLIFRKISCINLTSYARHLVCKILCNSIQRIVCCQNFLKIIITVPPVICTKVWSAAIYARVQLNKTFHKILRINSWTKTTTKFLSLSITHRDEWVKKMVKAYSRPFKNV